MTTLFYFLVDLQMAGRPNPFPMGVSDPFPAWYVIWFGSLEFRATGNGYLMERLPPRANYDFLTLPPQHQSRTGRRARQACDERRRVAPPAPRAVWGERATNWHHRGDDALLPATSTTTLTGGSSRPPPLPCGMRSSATTYASSVSTNMSAYVDLPWHHLLSIRNLITSTPDSSYPGSSDEESITARGRMNPEWGYSGVCDLEAFLSF